jgi:small GTP-binding protein
MSTEEVKELREFVYKIVLLGEAAVGKTSLLNRFCEGTFQEDYKPTLGANIIRKDVDLQEKYNVIRSMYFQGCEGALLVYDVTRYNTFDSVKSRWLRDFKKYIRKEGVYVLIGNKIDLTEERVVPTEKGKELADKINASHFIETSAKLGENIEEAFLLLVKQILNNHGVNV